MTTPRPPSPAVSVVIPTFQREQLLGRALDSIATLDTPPSEVIVVSDGSTDGTHQLVEERGLRLLQTDRRGPGAARNVGWRASRGEFVAFLDDDCVVSPDWLDELMRPFVSGAVGLAQGRTLPAGAVGPYDRTLDVVPADLLYESCNIAYRRTALEQAGGFDDALFERLSQRMVGRRRGAHFGEDTHLGWQVRRLGWEAARAPRAIAYHHVFPGTLADALREEWRSGNFALLIGEVPELRDLLPGGRYFLRRNGPLAQAALLGVALTLARKRWGALLALPYLGWLLSRPRGVRPGEQVLRDAARSAGLLVGSARARRVVL